METELASTYETVSLSHCTSIAEHLFALLLINMRLILRIFLLA